MVAVVRHEALLAAVVVADHRDSVLVIESDAMAAQKDELAKGRARVAVGRTPVVAERTRAVAGKIPRLGEEAI